VCRADDLTSSRDDCLEILGAQACNRIALHSTDAQNMKFSSVSTRMGGRRYKLLGPDNSKGVWDPNVLHKFLSFSIVSLYIERTN